MKGFARRLPENMNASWVNHCAAANISPDAPLEILRAWGGYYQFVAFPRSNWNGDRFELVRSVEGKTMEDYL